MMIHEHVRERCGQEGVRVGTASYRKGARKRRCGGEKIAPREVYIFIKLVFYYKEPFPFSLSPAAWISTRREATRDGRRWRGAAVRARRYGAIPGPCVGQGCMIFAIPWSLHHVFSHASPNTPQLAPTPYYCYRSLSFSRPTSTAPQHSTCPMPTLPS